MAKRVLARVIARLNIGGPAQQAIPLAAFAKADRGPEAHQQGNRTEVKTQRYG